MLRRFGAIGDVHGEDRLLEAALRTLAGEKVDAVLCVGDVADGLGDVDRCRELLVAHDVIVVRGNHERWLLEGRMRQLPHATERVDDETRAFFAALPPTRTLDTVRGKLLLCHAVGDDDMVRLTPEDEGPALTENEALRRVLASGVDFMVCGHTHRPMVRDVFGLLVINAGTLARDGHPSFLLVDLEREIVRTFELDEGGAVREARAIPLRQAPLGSAF